MKQMTKWISAVAVAASALLVGSTASAVVLWEWNDVGTPPGANSNNISFHRTTGPILADDFNPIASANVSQPGLLLVEWWGSAPLPSAVRPQGVNQFEVTFHTNDPTTNLPAIGPQFGGIAQLFVDAVASDANNDGVFLYSALWTPAPGSVRPFNPFTLSAGTDYWLSVANAEGNGWTWAIPGSPGGLPDVGTESFDAALSVGGLPSVISGPHDGPWTSIPDTDFAFRVSAVPVPAAVWLFGSGLIGLIGMARRRNS